MSNSLFQLSLLLVVYCVLTVTQCSLSWSISGRSLPVPSSGSAVAYSSNTNLIWLVGGWNNGFGLVAFQPEQVTINTTSPYIYNGEFESCTNNLCDTYFWGQGYTHLNAYHILYMTDTYSADFSIFNLSSQQFTHQYDAISNFPIDIGAGSNACLASIAHYILVAGGGASNRKAVQIFDLTSGQWISGASISDMDLERSYHACAVANNYFYVIGGRQTIQVQIDIVSKLYVGDIDNIAQYNWTDLNDTLRVASERIRAVTYGNDIYSIGGVKYDNGFITLPYVDLIQSNDRIIAQTDLLQAVDTVTPIIVGDMLLVLGGYNSGYKDYIQYAILPPTEEPTLSPTINPTNPTSNPSITPSAYPTSNPSATQSTTVPTASPVDGTTIANTEYFAESSTNKVDDNISQGDGNNANLLHLGLVVLYFLCI